jgi:hypothetical protein
MVNVVFELLFHGDIGHLYTGAAGSILPAMIGAPNAILFDPAKVKGRKPVGTVGADKTQLTTSGAKGDEVFTEQSDTFWYPTGLAKE